MIQQGGLISLKTLMTQSLIIDENYVIWLKKRLMTNMNIFYVHLTWTMRTEINVFFQTLMNNLATVIITASVRYIWCLGPSKFELIFESSHVRTKPTLNVPHEIDNCALCCIYAQHSATLPELWNIPPLLRVHHGVRAHRGVVLHGLRDGPEQRQGQGDRGGPCVKQAGGLRQHHPRLWSSCNFAIYK